MTDIFIAYSHEDLTYKNEFKKFLRPMLREEHISVWDDYDIEAGQEWDAKIKERLYGAGIILLLVSADSLASDYFYGKEVKVSIERHARGEAVVIPIILRHCDWENTPLGGLEALPEKGRPVVEWTTRDQAWQDVVSRLRRVVENVEKQREQQSAITQQLHKYQAAVEAATHFYDRQRWLEALTAFRDALTLHKPGFQPEKNQLEYQIGICDSNLQAEAKHLAEVERQTHADQLRAEQERKAKEHAEQQRQKEEQRIASAAARQHNSSNSAPADTGNSAALVRRLLWSIGITLVALFIVIWLIERPGKSSNGDRQNTSLQPTQTPDQIEAQAYTKVLKAKTIPDLQDYLSNYPSGKNAAAARQELNRLKKKYKELINDANLFFDDDRSTACKYLEEALLLAPGDSIVIKLKRRNCK